MYLLHTSFGNQERSVVEKYIQTVVEGQDSIYVLE